MIVAYGTPPTSKWEIGARLLEGTASEGDCLAWFTGRCNAVDVARAWAVLTALASTLALVPRVKP